MSRLLGVVSGRTIPPKLLRAFGALADTGRTPKDFGCPQPDPKPGHPDGWGIACMGEDEELYRRGAVKATADPKFEEAVNEVSRMANPPFLLLAHVRRSPRRDQVKAEFSHPFRREVGARCVGFAHDGGIEGYEVRQGRPDSLAIFDRILEALGPDPRSEADFKQAVASAKAALDAEFPRKVSSFTFVMIDGDRVVAHRDARSCVPHFALHETTWEGMEIICSEVLAGFEGKWRLLRNGEFLFLPSRS